MVDKESYFTLEDPSSSELKIKGSRFIGDALPVKSRQEAEACIARISRQYHDASHHCFAYRIGWGDRSVFRYSDAGEPSGTAGRPIMDALDSRRLSDLVCVVTRYFGGTKLGTGGLARAYNQCARETLSRGKLLPVHPVVVFHITFPYELTGKVHSLIAHFHGRIRQTLYGTGADLVVELHKSLAPDFRRRMTDISSGRATLRQEKDHAG